MARRENQNINKNDLGLTVGELTIGIGGLLLLLLLWTTFSSRKDNDQSLHKIYPHEISIRI